MVEPLGNSVQVPYTPCSHCEDEVREGSVQSNHSELTSKTSTHLAFSALKWFEKVRGGSRGTLKQCTGTLHILLPLCRCTEVVREGPRRFEGVEPLGNSVQVPYIPCYHCEDEVREGSV